jgi:hypothetical protein
MLLCVTHWRFSVLVIDAEVFQETKMSEADLEFIIRCSHGEAN